MGTQHVQVSQGHVQQLQAQKLFVQPMNVQQLQAQHMQAKQLPTHQLQSQQYQPQQLQAAQQPESTVKMQLGPWLVCEDALGEFYHHSQTGQSFEQPPAELLQLFQASQKQQQSYSASGYASSHPLAAPVHAQYR